MLLSSLEEHTKPKGSIMYRFIKVIALLLSLVLITTGSLEIYEIIWCEEESVIDSDKGLYYETLTLSLILPVIWFINDVLDEIVKELKS